MQESPVTAPSAPPPAGVKPFRFYTSLVLQESTGLRAATLPTLLKLLRTVPDSSIYYHTHYFLLQHHYLTPEPTNDFAYWVAEVLGDARLGELLASIDTMEHSTLQSLRGALAGTIERYLQEAPTARFRFVPTWQEFFFLKSRHVIMPTPYTASTLPGFTQVLRHISIHALYFHVFDARLRLGRPTNDFAIWLGDHLGLKTLAENVARLDPYAHNLETLRSILLSLLEQELERRPSGHA